MGCSESKEEVQRISVSSAKDKLTDSLKCLDVVRISSASSITSSSDLGSSNGSSSGPNTPADRKIDHVPEDSNEAGIGRGKVGFQSNFENIPINDLGESLDARRTIRQGNTSGISGDPTSSSTSAPGGTMIKNTTSEHPSSSSAKSNDSSDSGIYDLEEDYSFVITETSLPALIRKVELDFTPIENLDLTITGKACPRLLSGYQKARQEEQVILQGLREEGFIATSKQRSGGGVAFEIIEATPQTESAGAGKFKPMDFLPASHKKHLENQRNKFNLKNVTSEDVNRKLFLAQERRNLEIDARKEKFASMAKGIDPGAASDDLKEKAIQKKDAAMEKREAHLKELRDKLKEKNKRVQNIRLKKLINAPPVPVPVAVGARPSNDAFDSFFE